MHMNFEIHAKKTNIFSLIFIDTSPIYRKSLIPRGS